MYLREIESLRERHCSKVLAEARRQAKEIIRPAFRKARLRVSSMLAKEQTQVERKIQAAEARLRTARLQYRQRQQTRLLQLAYQVLLQSLASSWRDPLSRRRWVCAVLESGVARFPHSGWQVQHPKDWAIEEIEAARDYLEHHAIESPAFEPNNGLTAGVRILCKGVVLDATVAGLVSDRRRIEGRLLALVSSNGLNRPDEQRAHLLD